ncbi:zf-HC2 domain-containing protein [Occallatibacter savannae]|uniref:zf-HC2 domain-containing protein n=1 Tax=Occallatibacter savannae TaxID=1002691 RepID=UPI0013A55512|nr:zf-HC2 domain-containing protein [Occallatibacter savannae]
MMAAERYLLDELTPEERDAFELHLFGCQECALDLRAGAAFINEAKSVLPHLDPQPSASVPPRAAASNTQPKKNRWSFLWQPAFAAPAFALMLLVIGYQNFYAIPSLQRSASEPRLLYSNPIHIGTRGAAHAAVQADPTQGLALSLDLPQASTFASFAFELHDSNGKQIWTRTVGRPIEDQSIVSLVIPPSGLRLGSYTLTISGITPQNERVEIDRRVLDVQFKN